MFLATLMLQLRVPCEPLELISLGIFQSTARLALHSHTSNKHHKYSFCPKLVTSSGHSGTAVTRFGELAGKGNP